MQTVPISTLTSKVRGRIEREEILSRSAGEAMKLGLPSVARLVNKYKGKLIIAGGAPSIKDTLPQIRKQLRLSKRTKLLAINKTHDWLIKMGLKPDFGVMIDPKPWVSKYQTPTKGVKYLLGAKCDMSVFERFKGHPEVYLWHPLEDKQEISALRQRYKEWICIPGHSTTGLRSINLGYELGFREFELHGMDCSRDLMGDANAKRGNGHAYEKYSKEDQEKYRPESDLGQDIVYINSNMYGAKYFICSKHMARQLGEFENLLSEYDTLVERGEKQPITVKVAGTGALPYLAALKYRSHVNPKYNQDPTRMPYKEPDGIEAMLRPDIDPQLKSMMVGVGTTNSDERLIKVSA